MIPTILYELIHFTEWGALFCMLFDKKTDVYKLHQMEDFVIVFMHVLASCSCHYHLLLSITIPYVTSDLYWCLYVYLSRDLFFFFLSISSFN